MICPYLITSRSAAQAFFRVSLSVFSAPRQPPFRAKTVKFPHSTVSRMYFYEQFFPVFAQMIDENGAI